MQRISVAPASVLLVLILVIITLADLTLAAPPASALPIVDLGYERHQAIAFNETGGYYNFSNIRYAAPPTGQDRFCVPKSPAINRATVQTGDVDRICPQATPAWIAFAGDWVENYIFGRPLNVTAAELNELNTTYTLTNEPPMDPRSNEDCLFLDVMVPQSIFNNRVSSEKSAGAPVLVWIYGGGFAQGSKTTSGNPAGLIKRSMSNGMEGIVYVALNYRLGALGWLAGPTLQSDGVANAGLHDQRFALNWVQRNIHLFGGDPNRVTVIGESAGGSSIMHQITAYGGHESAPFARAIPQSAAFFPIPSTVQQEETFNRLLQLTNTNSVAQLRQLPTDKLLAANFLQIYESEYGEFTYGPVVDGTFVPALPGKLMLDGAFDKNVQVMVGHNSNEGLIFTDPLVQDETTVEAFIRQALPEASPAVLDYIENVLYPADFRGSYGYTNEIQRTALIVSEFAISCNSFYFDTAYDNKTYAYLFDVPPGIHGEDVPYTFYNGGGVDFSSLLLNTTVAIALQDFIVTFAENGVPTTPDYVTGIPKFQMYGENATVESLGLNSIVHAMDPAANSRCAWWQKALYA